MKPSDIVISPGRGSSAGRLLFRLPEASEPLGDWEAGIGGVIIPCFVTMNDAGWFISDDRSEFSSKTGRSRADWYGDKAR